MTPVFDELGELIGPQFHDGLLFGIVGEEGAVRLHARTLGGDEFIVRLNRVEAFRCNGFAGANTITDFWALSGASADTWTGDLDETLDDLIGRPHPGIADQYKQEYRDRHAAIRHRIAGSELQFVIVLFAEECEIGALCTRVTVEKPQ